MPMSGPDWDTPSVPDWPGCSDRGLPMTEAGTFLTTPVAQPAPDTEVLEAGDRRHEITIVPMAQAEAILPDWRALIAESLDDNPFLSPAFMIPAASHLVDGGGLSLAAVWEHQGGIRRLAGLVPLSPARRSFGGGWLMAGAASLWRHPLQPFCAPLLAGPPERAAEALSSFMDWLIERRPRLTSLSASGLPVDGQATALLLGEAFRRGLPVERQKDAAHTHGFDFTPAALPSAAAAVHIARAPGEVRAALEAMLCFGGEMALRHPQQATFLRAAVRSFSLQNGVVIALLDKGRDKAGAIVIQGRDRAYLWWLMGPSVTDPSVEMALAAAVGRALGRPVAAATARPLTGMWTEPLVTESLSIGLSANVSALAARMRLRMNSFPSF
jgi:Acetyltransferase (GNAT) domain